MKKFILIALVFGLFACDNELDLTAEWKDIPIIHGMLSAQDEVHYIRIEKAFLDEEISALELAQNPDSIYYTDALVQIERPTFNSTITLERIDASKEGIPREEGIFANAPNVLYRFETPETEPLEGGESLRLSIRTSELAEEVTAETVVVGALELVDGQPGERINWEYDRVSRFAWRPDPNAYIYDVRLLINYEETVEGSNSEFELKQVEWKLAENLVRTSFSENTRERIEILGEDFFRFLEGVLEPGETKIRRFVDMEFVVTAGGEELVEFIRIQQANTGITSSQVVPTFTNINGGIGLFTSRNRAFRKNIDISAVALDSLQNGIYTRQLNFRD